MPDDQQERGIGERHDQRDKQAGARGLFHHALIVLFFWLLSTPAFAQTNTLDGPPSLSLPVDCAWGVDCWLMNLPDADPAPGRQTDFMCGGRTYDAHDGTDIAVVAPGTQVLAAAEGTVLRLRDGAKDGFLSREAQAALLQQKKACGNGIVIDHGNGWSTQYCHLQNGSVAVKPGQAVRRGDAIAKIGLSGVTDHPHLHIVIRRGDVVYDPFTGRPAHEACAREATRTPLWRDRLPYQDFALYDAGFAADMPDFDGIGGGLRPPEPTAASRAVTFWFAYWGAKKGDRITIRIQSPQGMTMTDFAIVQDRDRARQYYGAGKKLAQGWPGRGTYRAVATVARTGPGGENMTRTIKRDIVIPADGAGERKTPPPRHGAAAPAQQPAPAP